MLGFLKRGQQQEFALEVLATILQTGKPQKVLNEVIERLNRSGERELAEKFGYAKNVYTETNPVEAFYRADLITDEVYRYLSVVQQKGGLTAHFVKQVIQDLRDRGKATKETFSLLIMPAIYILLSGIIGVQIGGQFMNLLKTMNPDMEIPAFLFPHEFAMNHPFLAFLFLVGILFVILIGGTLFALRKIGYKELKLYQIASVVEVLRRQKVPYSETFFFIASSEKDKKYRELEELIAFEAQRLSALEALSPLLELLPIQVSLIFSSFIERNDEIAGWHYLKETMREIFNSKLNTLKNIVPIVGLLLVAFIVIYALAPLAVAIRTITKMLSVGAF